MHGAALRASWADGRRTVLQKWELRSAPAARCAVRVPRTADGRFGAGRAKYARALRIPRASHADGSLVSAGAIKEKATRRWLFLLFLAETVECVIIAETGMVTGFHRYSQIPYPHLYPKKKRFFQYLFFQHTLDLTPDYISRLVSSKKTQPHNVENAVTQARSRQAALSVGLSEFDSIDESDHHGGLPGFSGASAPFAQNQ